MLKIPPIINNKPPSNTKVVVAMSGGVDSSTVAACLKNLGYQVIGVTLQLYNGSTKVRKGSCCAGQDIQDAQRVASKFDFPHYVVNYESLFKQKVIDDFVDTYLQGETPIPCVRCNQTVKFHDLLGMAKKLGADAMATGHYVSRRVSNEEVEMHTAQDRSKDQSYFLFTTTQEQLKFLRFPLGEITKSETRQIAQRLNIETANKADSQDICFVQDGSYSRLVEKLRPSACNKGNIKHINGKVLGQHNGIINYTVGQRKGLNISSPEPLYVAKISTEHNEVIVGPKQALAKNTVNVKEVNWISQCKNNDKIQVKLRYQTQAVNATIRINDHDNSVTLQLDEEQYGVSPGQAAVFYKNSQVLGGGWIYNAEHKCSDNISHFEHLKLASQQQ